MPQGFWPRSRILQESQIEICKPMGYVDFVRLSAGANKILTDSGGVRREAYLLRKPCIVLINLSWFPEISEAGWKVLTGPDPDRIAHLGNELRTNGSSSGVVWRWIRTSQNRRRAGEQVC